MIIYIKVKPGSKHESIVQTGEKHYTVSVKEPAHEGKANNALIGLLANHFSVSKAYVHIHSGHMSKNKVVEIIK